MILTTLIATLCAVVLSAIDWGLATRRVDAYLFSTHTIWDGKTLATFDPARNNDAIGADVDRNPVDASAGPVELNDTDAKRAEILRRYRLFSNQPDEMITFMSLQQMKPGEGKLDPKLYQYGGVWIYGTGALLKIASIVHLIDLRPDKAFYYDHPEAFSAFYIVARFYTLIWYAILLVVVAQLARKITASDLAGFIAAAIVGLSPVVFAMAHEAKPHLPGVALMCLACLAANRWTESPGKKWAFITGAICGLAAGMVASAVVIGLILPTMIFLITATARERVVTLLTSLLSMLAAYAITNPYVVIHLINDHLALVSNASNTSAMYAAGSFTEAAGTGALRFLDAASIPLLIAGAICVMAIVLFHRRAHVIVILLTIPAVFITIGFFIFASGKPAEYARFAMFPVVVIATLCAASVAMIPRTWVAITTGSAFAIAMLAFATRPYILAFAADTQQTNTRLAAASQISQLSGQGKTLQIYADPAPYCLPPVALWQWRIILTNRHAQPVGDVIIRPIDDPAKRVTPIIGYTREIFDGGQPPAPITWANKPFELLIRNP